MSKQAIIAAVAILAIALAVYSGFAFRGPAERRLTDVQNGAMR